MISARLAQDNGELSIHRGTDHILILLRCAALMLPDDRPAVLDLGCGSGDLARACGDLAFGAWTGVDQSALALESARKGGYFETLGLHSAEEFLAADKARYSVVVCGKGLPCRSELSGLFASVAQRLLPGGVFLFTTEELPPGAERWRIGASHRYAHTVAYLEAIAAAAGFIVPTTYLAPLRADNGQPVMGRVTMLQRTGAAAQLRGEPAKPSDKAA